MQKLKHIKYTKLSPIIEKIPSLVESPFCRTPKKIWRAASAGDFLVVFVLNLVRWSRHLVIDFGLLGNRMYWSCQRFVGKGLVVVREGISTPNTPYLRSATSRI